MIHIAVTCCLMAVALAAPQGYGGGRGGYGGRQGQASALPMPFSVSKPAYNQGGAAAGGQYGGSGGQAQYGAGQYQGSNGGQYATEDPYAEPANYEFSYEVNAPEYNVQFAHQESRRDMFAKGYYTVLLPDGRLQRVDYEADQEGYRPTITYQEAAGGRGGYGQGGANGGYGQGGNGGSSQGGNGGYSQGGNGGYSQNGNGGYSQNGNGGYSQNGNGGYGQNGGNGYSKGGSFGKSSYGQKNNGYSQNGSRY